MYKQTTNSIKLAIIPLDGTLFNLNKLRYNYCKNFAESKGLELSKLDFYKRLSNNYDMYDGFSFSSQINISSFSSQIENDLKSYFEYHTLETKPGAQALFEGLKNKGIKIAVISTHREEDARFYLNKSGLIRYCDLVIGVDNGFRPLPTNDMLKAIQAKFGVLSQDVLVISSFTTLNKAAESLAYNIVYVKDFVNPTQYDIASSYKCVTDLYNVLNVVLFDRYDDASLYASVLGFNSKMNRAQLSDRYNHLLATYGDDQEIINVVEKTYKEYVAKLNDGIQYVDFPSESTVISDSKREDITQQVQKSLLNDENEVNELFKEETVEMMVQRMANDEPKVVEETQPVKEETVEEHSAFANLEETKEEPVIEDIEETNEDIEITNSQLVSELFKEKTTQAKPSDQEINRDVKLTIDKLRASLDQNIVNDTREFLNPQMLENVTEEHSTPTFRIVSEKAPTNTIIIDPDATQEVNDKVQNDYDQTIEVEHHSHQSEQNNIQSIVEDDHDDFLEDTHQHHHHHSKSYSIVDWLIDLILILLINLLVCVLCAILYIVFIERGVISNSIILNIVSCISIYVNLCVKFLGTVISKIISDSFIAALVCVYIVNSIIIVFINTIIKLIRH